ncbi:MAG: glycoside hydrolase family 95-like protein [Rikenellaceae bacterium]
MRVRGGAEVGAEWQEHRLRSATLRATAAGEFNIAWPDNVALDSADINGEAISCEQERVLRVSLQQGEVLSLRYR